MWRLAIFLAEAIMTRNARISVVLLMLVAPICRAQSLGEKIASEYEIDYLRKSAAKTQARKVGLNKLATVPCGLDYLSSARCAKLVGSTEFLPPYPPAFDSGG